MQESHGRDSKGVETGEKHEPKCLKVNFKKWDMERKKKKNSRSDNCLPEIDNQ